MVVEVAARDVRDRLAGELADAFEIVPGDLTAGLLLVCDHASNAMPEQFGTLGLPPSQLERHIAYDIGAEAVTRAIASELGVPAVMSRFSRLLIDPNRGRDDPTLVMLLSDGAVIPANKALDDAGRNERLERFYAPYDDAVGRSIKAFDAVGVVPMILSIHSFTPSWKGVERPWDISLLWDDDPRMVKPLLEELRKDDSIVVGENVPYSGHLGGDMMNRHATRGGLAHALVEIRQDEITSEAGQARWGQRIAGAVSVLMAHDELSIELHTRRKTVEEIVAAQIDGDE